MDSGFIAMGTIRRRPITPLRRAIFEAGLTQRDLADLTAINEADISRIVRGLHPTDDRKRAIAKALHWDVTELWPADGQENAA